jgi:type II secretory pathway pseudopilin PulG
LVELAVVIVIIGVLAAFGVPKFLASVERSKAAEAFNYLSAVRAAQERYIAKEGHYAALVTDLDIVQADPKYFTVGTIEQGKGGGTVLIGGVETPVPEGTSYWKLQLTRIAATSSYGGYTVQFTDAGFDTDVANSSIMSPENVVICPIGS